MKGKYRKADSTQAATALLTLFGTCENTVAGESYAGLPYTVPGDIQLRMTDTLQAIGNRLPCAQAFGEALHLYQAVEAWHGGTHKDVQNALTCNRFSFACGSEDPCYLAVQCILNLILRRDVKKFIIPVRGTAEKEAISRTLCAYVEQVSREMGYSTASAFQTDGQWRNAAPDVIVYGSGGSEMTKEKSYLALEQLRRFVSASTPQILLINREFFIRPSNLLRRPCPQFDDDIPLQYMQAGRPVLITVSQNGRGVARLLEKAAVLSPLCSLSFTVETDFSGVTVPVYTPGCTVRGEMQGEMEQIGFAL